MMDKDYLYQIDIREWIERGLDADIMVPVSGNKIDKKYDIYLQSFLLPLNEVENDMENDTYNAHTLMPGITVYGSWEDDEKVYHRWGNDNGYEPLVIKREYNGVATDSIEIVEEFRLLFNLYFNSQKNEYIDVSNGEGITVVKMNDNGYVTIHKRYLKTYLAVKEKVLMIHIDSRCVCVGFWDNQADTIFRSATVDGFRFPDVGIAPTCVRTSDKVNIHVEPVSYNADDRVELSEIFNGNEALIKKYAEKLSISFERVEYAKNNFIRVVKVMKAFILNDSVKSFLCLNNKLPQENKGLFDIKLLEEFADAIIKLYGIKGLKGKELLYSINSEDYDAKRAEFIQRLSKGEKLFVISSYNTVGAGQNLQYKAPGNATIVAVNDYDRGDMEKDFDCIYLEKPTNLLVNVDSKKGIEAEDLIRFVYQMEFLMERGEVSRKDGIAVIKDAFICFSGGYTFSGKKGEPYKTDSVNNFAIRTLIQAVGRICRTGLKNPDIYIYVDNTILTDYDLSIVEQRMLNPEFAELVKVGKTYFNGQANENLDIAVMENRAGTLALKAMQIINELKRNWTDDSIDYWKALRELCLMRPTLSRKNVEHNSQYQLVYMCAPGEITAYSYEQEGDYNKNITIKFDGRVWRG